jgi:hypothetical protein
MGHSSFGTRTSFPQPVRRRRLLTGAAALTALAPAAVRSLIGPAAATDPRPPAPLALRPVGGGVASLDLPLDGRLVPAGPRRWRTAGLTTAAYHMVGVTWRGPASADVRVRVRTSAGWRSWMRMPLQHDRPDRPEHRGIHGTQPMWTGPADGIQVEVRGRRPGDLTLALLRLDGRPEDTAPHPDAQPMVAETAARPSRQATRAPRPFWYTRAQWGADPRWRNGRVRYCRTIKQVHIHHTATANDYTRADVPRILRGIYRYHTHSLGWFDIGYNFLVDKFGRIWVGRSGGPSRPVRGAHTLGFNHESTGVAVIGDHQDARPSYRVVTKLVRLAAWKLDAYGRDPAGTTLVFSQGSDRFPRGQVVRLPVIDGHRDTNETECPGNRLYALLPTIRRRAAARVARFEP